MRGGGRISFGTRKAVTILAMVTESGTFWGRLRRRGADPHRSTAVTSPADARAWAEVAGTKLSGGA